MTVYSQDDKAKANRIFISYSSIDRVRTNGLSLLLEAMGHQVFHDHRTIKPGMRWKAALQDGLDDAEALMVFWTGHASRSDWVRKEYEYFAAQYPDRLLIPVVGDETPLAELLKTRQQADFVPVVNEVLEMKRRMKKEGAGAAQIEGAVRERLGEAGVEIKASHQKRLLFLFLGFGWLLSLLRYPGSLFSKARDTVVEKTAQATAGQAVVIAAAAGVDGGVAYPVAQSAIERELPTDVTELMEEIGELKSTNRELEQNNEELLAEDGKLDDVQSAIVQLSDQIDQLPRQGEVSSSCVTPEDFAACQTEITDARDTLDNRLIGISDLLGSMALVAGESEPSATSEILESNAEIGECGTELEPVFRFNPEYPEQAKSLGQQGDVIVRATIDPEGNVTDVVAETGEHDILKSTAIDAMSRWKFEVCTVEGNPRAATRRVRFKFYIH